MITYLEISLFDSPAQTLVNTVNTVGVMGKGIAAVFKKLYPDMFERYSRYCLEGKLDVGRLYVYRTNNKIIVNFPTKKHWRNPSQVSYIEAGLRKFVTTYQQFGITSVSFPQLGCGHGELDWERQVQPLMEKYLTNLPIPVYIHLYSQSPGFIPERLDVAFAKGMRLERQRISINQLWLDLQQIVSRSPYLIDLFTTVEMDKDHIQFLVAGQKGIVYRDDLEDLWNLLRIRGTIRASDLPLHISSQYVEGEGVGSYLFMLLEKLDYIEPVTMTIRREAELVRESGLRYAPNPDTRQLFNSEMVI